MRARVGHSPIMLPSNLKPGIDELVRFLNSHTPVVQIGNSSNSALFLEPFPPQSIHTSVAHAISRTLQSTMSMENDEKVSYNVKINAKTMLMKVIFHPPGAVVEYPETSAHGRIGHVFTLNAESWINPTRSFAYSQGEPSSGGSKSKPVFIPLLKDGEGNMVPCIESHSTCAYLLLNCNNSNIILARRSRREGMRFCRP